MKTSKKEINIQLSKSDFGPLLEKVQRGCIVHINIELGENKMPFKRQGTVIIQRNGKDYTGFYNIEEDIIKVCCTYGEKTTQLSLMPPKVLAEMLLREIIMEKTGK